MEQKAIGKYIGVSQKKANIPVKVVRGMSVENALNALKYMQKGAAIHVLKVIESAYANASKKGKVDAKRLIVKEIKADRGPSQRRIYYKAKGGYRFFNRPTSHITVVLGD
jgi:large subunit ribosomal protein L22